MEAKSIYIPDELTERLTRVAGVTGRTKTSLATEAICRYLDDLEDLCLAETRWRELQEGCSKTIPLEKIADQYTLDDRNP